MADFMADDEFVGTLHTVLDNATFDVPRPIIHLPPGLINDIQSNDMSTNFRSEVYTRLFHELRPTSFNLPNPADRAKLLTTRGYIKWNTSQHEVVVTLVNAMVQHADPLAVCELLRYACYSTTFSTNLITLLKLGSGL